MLHRKDIKLVTCIQVSVAHALNFVLIFIKMLNAILLSSQQKWGILLLPEARKKSVL